MFLNPLMLAGLGAAVIPLVLHLLSKARYRPVEWGAMMFLESTHARQQRTAKLKQMILLLLRMAIVAGLAVGMARPILRRGGENLNAAEPQRVHAIIILDRSASMGFRNNGRSRFAAAKQAVVNILSNLHRGDEISLILMGDGSEGSDVQPTTDLQSVASRVGSLSPSFGRARIDLALDHARQILSRNPTGEQEIYLVCDRQAKSWESVNSSLAQSWRQAQGRLKSAAKFFVILIGGDESDNVAVESVDFPGPPPVRDVDCDVRVTIRNYGSVPRSDLPLTLHADNRPLAQTTVNLQPNSTTTTMLGVRFPSSGSQIVSARIDTNGLRGDDQIDRAIDVLEPVRVLVISGDQSIRPTNKPDYLQLALAPHQSAGKAGADPASVRMVGDDDWWGLSPDRDDVVILDDVSQLSNDRVRELEQFVYSGGGLIVAMGDLADADSYNGDFYRDGEGFLPASLVASDSSPASAAHLKQVEMTHPIFAFLHGDAQALLQPTIRRSMDVDEIGPDAQTLAMLSNGQPFLIERPYGSGRVLMLTSSLDGDWTSLPLTDFYLPFVQSLARYAAGAMLPDRNLLRGQPIEVTFNHQPANRNGTMLLPDGEQRSVQIAPAGSQWTARFDETSQPGRYVLTVGQGGAAMNYVVSPGHDESDLTPLTPARLAWLQKALDFRLVKMDHAALSAAIVSARSGREWYLPIIALVVCLAIFEMILARFWSSRRCETSTDKIQISRSSKKKNTSSKMEFAESNSS